MIVPIQETSVYHEAGHAAMFAHFGITIDYVSIRPDLVNGYGGVVKTAVEPPQSGKLVLEDWMRSSAAGRLASDHRLRLNVPSVKQPTFAVPDVAKLISEFEEVAVDLAANPDRPGHDDLRNFVGLGLLRDVEVEDSQQIGPRAWVQTWLEADQLVRGELWPAVRAVFESLWEIAIANKGKPVESMPDLSGRDVAAIVSAVNADIASTSATPAAI